MSNFNFLEEIDLLDEKETEAYKDNLLNSFEYEDIYDENNDFFYDEEEFG